MAENWREGSVQEQQKHMLEIGYLSDCCFLVGQEPDTKEFRAHKNIMSRSSEVFHVMFYGALSEKDVVRVTDVTPEAFQALLYYVYCDTLEISDVEMSLSVCSAAHKYNMKPLINKCTEYITGHMAPDNVCQVLEFSNLTDNTQLKTHCIKMLQLRTEEVLSADSWCDMQMSSIVTLLQQDTLNVQSELTLLSACQRWAQHQLDLNNQPAESEASARKNEENKLRKMFKPFLPYIRILSLTTQQFLQSTELVPIFSKLEQLAIFQCFTDPRKYKMPEGMCEISTAREIRNSSVKSMNNIIDEIKEHLEAQQMVVTSFSSSHASFIQSIKVRTVPITINNYIVVYGFSFQTLQFSAQDRLIQARLLKRSKIYDENFTVQFIKEDDKSVVAEYKYKGMLQYDTEVQVDFSQPFFADRSILHSFKVEFHHQNTERKYPVFYSWEEGNLNFSIPKTTIDNMVKVTQFPHISKLFCKVV